MEHGIQRSILEPIHRRLQVIHEVIKEVVHHPMIDPPGRLDAIHEGISLLGEDRLQLLLQDISGPAIHDGLPGDAILADSGLQQTDYTFIGILGEEVEVFTLWVLSLQGLIYLSPFAHFVEEGIGLLSKLGHFTTDNSRPQLERVTGELDLLGPQQELSCPVVLADEVPDHSQGFLPVRP